MARWQLLRRGLTSHEIEGLIARGHLQRLHVGVYAVGHADLDRSGRWHAAVLAGGPGGVLSHRSAAQAWGLLWPRELDPEVTRSRPHRRRSGIRSHQAALLPDEVTEVDEIPVTTAFRTAFDVAGLGDRRLLEVVVHEIEVKRIAEAVSFEELLRRHPRKRGVRMLSEVRASKAPVGITRNEFEESFVAFLDEHELPRAEMNAALAVRERFFEIDALWRAERLAVELDSREVHDTDDAFESDRERDRILLAEGWRTTRVTWRQLRDQPEEIAADLRALLAPHVPFAHGPRAVRALPR
ncbi:MAG TPA: hypothetical protein VGI73_15405 [Solirubrobacterales bacterium]